MLSQAIAWVDIDPVEWANLWQELYGILRRPRRVIAILDQGRPLALLDSAVGQIDLDRWPAQQSSAADIASFLRIELAVDQVILAESSVLADLWDEQQRLLAHAADRDFDSYTLALCDMTWRALLERAVCDPPATDLVGYPPIRYAELRKLLADATAPDGSFLVTVFDQDALWWSLAGRVRAGSIERLTSSLGLRPPGTTPPTGAWQCVNTELLAACARELGEIRFGLAIQLASFRRLLVSPDPEATIAAAVSRDEAIVHRTVVRQNEETRS